MIRFDYLQTTRGMLLGKERMLTRMLEKERMLERTRMLERERMQERMLERIRMLERERMQARMLGKVRMLTVERGKMWLLLTDANLGRMLKHREKEDMGVIHKTNLLSLYFSCCT